MQNEIGALDRIAKTIADKGVNILAMSTWVEGAQAIIRLVTDDQRRVHIDPLAVQRAERRHRSALALGRQPSDLVFGSQPDYASAGTLAQAFQIRPC